jgi:hypothetical protein
MTGDVRPARTEAVEIHEVVDGFVVYDPATDKVHYLNHTAALVLQLCDGSNTAEDIGRFIRDAYDLSEAPAAEVADCLTLFVREGLVT